jgi:hypothetical protein
LSGILLEARTENIVIYLNVFLLFYAVTIVRSVFENLNDKFSRMFKTMVVVCCT